MTSTPPARDNEYLTTLERGFSVLRSFSRERPEMTLSEVAALQVGFEFPLNMVGQGLALLGQLVHQSRVVRLNELIEKSLLGLIMLVGSSIKSFLALCQHGGSSLGLHRAQRTRLGQRLEECHVQAFSETAIGNQICPVYC